MSARGLSPADHIAQYALLSRLVSAALAVAAAGGFDQLNRGRASLAVSIVLIVVGNYLALRRWSYVVDVVRVRDKPLYLTLDVTLALSVILAVGAASPLVLYLLGSVVLAGLVYSGRFAVVTSVVVVAGYLAVLISGRGAAPGTLDVHSLFTLPALILGAGPAAAAVRRLLRLRERDAVAVVALREQMAVREERLRLSRDVHDSITKNLHGLALLAGGLVRAVDRGRLEQARDTAELVALTARQLADSSRGVILDLREEADADLAATVRAVAAGTIAGHGLLVEQSFSDDFVARAGSLDVATRAAIAAAVGEAVHNVVKHAGAMTVTVEGTVTGGGCAAHRATGGPADVGATEVLTVAVRDDGRGLCPDEAETAAAAGHLGLVGMRERLHGVGGGVVVTSAAGAGTTVAMSVPLPHAVVERPARVRAPGRTIEGMAHG